MRMHLNKRAFFEQQPLPLQKLQGLQGGFFWPTLLTVIFYFTNVTIISNSESINAVIGRYWNNVKTIGYVVTMPAKKLDCIMLKNASWNMKANSTSTGRIMKVNAANTGLADVKPAAIMLAIAPTINAITIASANMPKLVFTFLTASLPCGVAFVRCAKVGLAFKPDHICAVAKKAIATMKSSAVRDMMSTCAFIVFIFSSIAA